MTDSTVPPPEHERPPTTETATAAEEALAEAAEVVEPLEQLVDITPLDHSRRMLLVHAHPDDESIATGATMARYAAENALVTLVTCTLGEQGEVLVPELAHLAADKEDRLGQHRIGELAAACEALGVSDHRFLGGPGRWRDSGMMGEPTNDRPDCFWRADLDEATLELVQIMREVRPQVVVTYDENGGYGHPDHIQAHRVTVAAFDAAGDPSYHPEVGEPWQPAKLYYSAMPASLLRRGMQELRERGFEIPFDPDADELPTFVVPDEQVTTEIDARAHFDAKIAALRAHATQIAVNGMFFALADGLGQRAWAIEYFRLVRGEPGERGPTGREDDLFAGVH